MARARDGGWLWVRGCGTEEQTYQEQEGVEEVGVAWREVVVVGLGAGLGVLQQAWPSGEVGGAP